MPLRSLHTADSFVYQRTGNIEEVPVVYLPGVHGCWTPMDQARPLFTRHCDLVEVAYPFFDDWSLEHYADSLLHLLHELELERVHLVAESFGSLVAWQFGLMHPSRVRSLVLVGGFCQAPGMYLAATAGVGLSVLPAAAFDKIVDTYVSFKAARGEPRKVSGVKAYPGVRGSKAQKATSNRMRLIQGSDFRKDLPRVSFPVRYIGGSKDRVIPVEREVQTLSQLLPGHSQFDSYLIPNAPHAIIASHPDETVGRIVHWVEKIEGEDRCEAQ